MLPEPASVPHPEIGPKLRTERLWAYFDGTAVIKGVSLDFAPGTVTAIIGSSGCGKSTLLRCLNRLHELVAGASVAGAVYLDGENIYGPETDPVELRRRVGMVFQRPTPFPTMSIYDNVAAGLRVGAKRYSRSELDELVEKALRDAALWEEVKDRLRDDPLKLSGGQQQRLCIARAVAPKPDVLLLDEPTASLDPAGTQAIEDLIQELKRQYTVIMVTHNLHQAARVSDYAAFLYLGELVEFGSTATIFTRPRSSRTEAYVTGRFG